MADIVDCVRVRVSGDSARKDKANTVRHLGRKLLRLWREKVSEVKGATWYFHAVVHHLPDLIERLPVDVLLASGDSFEAKNQQLKGILRRFDLVCVLALLMFVAGEPTSGTSPAQ